MSMSISWFGDSQLLQPKVFLVGESGWWVPRASLPCFCNFLGIYNDFKIKSKK